MNLLRTAIDLAYELHAGQFRCGLPLPFITHPCDVIRRLVHWGVEDYTVLAAAALHDTLEDTSVTPYVLTQAVGSQVVALIEALTYDGPHVNPDAKQQWIEGFVNKSDEALIVKLADRYCNVEDFILTDLAYAGKYLRKADKLVDALFGRIGRINQRFKKPAGSLAYEEFCRLNERV